MNLTGLNLRRSLKMLVMIVPVAAVMVLLSGCGAYTGTAQGNMGTELNADDVAYLAGYGDWITVQPYGEVWQPWVTAGWRPFTYGDWAWSDPDWAWVSYEPYGWLVYHYGEWGYRPGTGWFWVPGDTWSPSQTEWYTWDDYSSWAPLPPDGMDWGEPWSDQESDAWTTVPLKDFDHENVGQYRVDKAPHEQGETHSRELRHQPGVKIVERSTNQKSVRTTKGVRSIKMGSREYQRMVLHQEQEKILARHRANVAKKVLVPRAEYHRRVEQQHEQRARASIHRTEHREHASANEKHGESSGKETHGHHHRR